MSKEAEEFFRNKRVEMANNQNMKNFFRLVDYSTEAKIMQEYSDLQNQELKAKVRELELPRGVKLCDCPECGAEIQFGISEELKEKFKNIKLRK